MPFAFDYTLNGEKRFFCGMRDIYYEFPSGETLPISNTSGWCWCKKDIACVEMLESVGSLDEYASRVRAENNADTDYLEELAHRRLFLLSRRSPAKCLLCGREDWIPLSDEDEMVCPNGDVIVLGDDWGIASTHFKNWFYTPEGERILRDTKET